MPPDNICARGAFCGDGICAAMKATGGTCVDSAECIGGSCENGVCVAAAGSCHSSKTFFPLYVILSAAFPLRRRLRLRGARG